MLSESQYENSGRSLSPLSGMMPNPRHAISHGSNISSISACAIGLPSWRTTRRYWFSTSARRSSICRHSMHIDSIRSEGSKPETTHGTKNSWGMKRKAFKPMTVATWPGRINPSICTSGAERSVRSTPACRLWFRTQSREIQPFFLGVRSPM
jgi:hypothetical protein